MTDDVNTGPKRQLWRLLREYEGSGKTVAELARYLGVNAGLIWMSRPRGARMSPSLVDAMIDAGELAACKKEIKRAGTFPTADHAARFDRQRKRRGLTTFDILWHWTIDNERAESLQRLRDGE